MSTMCTFYLTQNEFFAVVPATFAEILESPSIIRADYVCDSGDASNIDCITYIMAEMCASSVYLNCPHGTLTVPLTYV